MGRGGPAVSRLPVPTPHPPARQAASLRAAAERRPTKWSRPGPAPRRGTRAAAVPAPRSAPLPAPVPKGSQRDAGRGSPPAPAGLGLPSAIVRRAPRAGLAPPPRSPAALPRTSGPGRRPPRGCRAEPCEPCRASPAGERRRVPAAWFVLAGLRRSRTAALPPALPPPSGAHRTRARPLRRDGPPPPPPATSPAHGLAAGGGSVATSDAGRGLRRQPRGSGRRAAPPPHRHGWGGGEQWWQWDALRHTAHLLCHLCPRHGQRPQEGPFSGPSLPAEEQGNGIPAPAARSCPDVRHSGQRGRPCRRGALSAGCGGSAGGRSLSATGFALTPRPRPPPAQHGSPRTPGLRSQSGRWLRSLPALQAPSAGPGARAQPARCPHGDGPAPALPAGTRIPRPATAAPVAATMPKAEWPLTGGSRSVSPESGGVTAGRRGGPELSAEGAASPAGAVGRVGWLPGAPGSGPSAGHYREAMDGGRAQGERGPGGQHCGRAQRAGGGGWEQWPWGWSTAGSVGERVKESRRAGGGLARPRKEAEEERRGAESILPGGFAGGPFPPGSGLRGLKPPGWSAGSRGGGRGSAWRCARRHAAPGRLPGAGAAPLAGVTPRFPGPSPHSPPAVLLPWPPETLGGGQPSVTQGRRVRATSFRGQEPSLPSNPALRGRAVAGLVSPGGQSPRSSHMQHGDNP
ncbi:collagen alpha-1(I) chain-like [Pseudopipra pipra]|uniref:collagen alpha-1(I) chain-like n=1 Tax=Pseudopipra pipra TaxID=415032 RepID=UPI003138D9B6